MKQVNAVVLKNTDYFVVTDENRKNFSYDKDLNKAKEKFESTLPLFLTLNFISHKKDLDYDNEIKNNWIDKDKIKINYLKEIMNIY